MRVGVVTSTSKVNKDCKSGSTTSDTFVHFGFCKPMRERVEKEKPLVLVLDSGGGTFLHMSPRFIQAAHVHPFFLPAYTTRCLCALDQTAHSEMSKLWSQFQQLWPQKGLQGTLFVALKAAEGLCRQALTPAIASASWRHIGLGRFFCSSSKAPEMQLWCLCADEPQALPKLPRREQRLHGRCGCHTAAGPTQGLDAGQIA